MSTRIRPFFVPLSVLPRLASAFVHVLSKYGVFYLNTFYSRRQLFYVVHIMSTPLLSRMGAKWQNAKNATPISFFFACPILRPLVSLPLIFSFFFFWSIPGTLSPILKFLGCQESTPMMACSDNQDPGSIYRTLTFRTMVIFFLIYLHHCELFYILHHRSLSKDRGLKKSMVCPIFMAIFYGWKMSPDLYI